MANKSHEFDAKLDEFANAFGEKMSRNIETAEANPNVPRADIASAARNLFQILEQVPGGSVENLDASGVKRGKSGQYKFRESDKFETVFSDGSVRKGLHGISLFAAPHSDYKGPKCDNCGRIHDLKLCSRCKKVRYCDSDCQKNHWPVHKQYCKN